MPPSVNTPKRTSLTPSFRSGLSLLTSATGYVFLSVDPALTQEPRLDLLDKVLGALRTVPGLQVDWKVGRGPDRTR